MRLTFSLLLGLSIFISSCKDAATSLSPYRFVSKIFSTQGMTPNFFTYRDSSLLLSWIETDIEGNDLLKWAAFDEDQWNLSGTIASGRDWFVNWADFPAMAQNKSLVAAHWLKKSAEGTYDYDIHVALSHDYGQNWDTSFIIHKDKVAAEHGFVSLMPEGEDGIRAVWLDGRLTKISEENQIGVSGDHGGHVGAMTLRTALIHLDGSLQDEKELDNRVCDCCQTDLAVVDSVVLVVYRDRSADEIRDMGIIRRVNGIWNSPSILHQDGWQIAGCPVNGPAISANQNGEIAVAWFTAPNNVSKVQLMISKDYGETFSKPITVTTDSTLGRVDVAWMEDDIVVSQLVSTPATQQSFLQLSIFDMEGHKKYEEKVAPMLSSRESGFPVMEVFQDKVWLTWTVLDSVSQQKNIQVGFVESI